MAVNAVSFVLGSVFLFAMTSVPPWWVCAVLAALALCVWRRLPPLCWCACGFLLAAWHAHSVIDARLGAEWLNREVAVTGVVAGLPERDEHKTRFLLVLEQACQIEPGLCESLARPQVRISWYRDAPLIRAGQRWRLRVKLREPRGFMNPGGFDYEKWLFQQRIIATGYVRNAETAVHIEDQTHPVHWMQGMRWWLKQRLHAALEGRDHAGLVMALAMGDRSGIERQQWQQFIATGTNHLLAISGLHISLVAAFAAMLATVLWKNAAVCRRVSRHSFALGCALLAAFCYAGLAGFSVPTQRALLMFGTVVVLSLIARHQNRQHGLLLALAIVCALDPLVVLSAGFWMSFAAVAILLSVYAFVQDNRRGKRLLSLVRGHLLITIGLYPFGLWFFGHLSLISPLANLVAVPMVGLLLTPVIFVATLLSMITVPLARFVFVPVDWLLSLVVTLLAALSDWPFALTHVSAVHNPVMLWSAGLAVLCLLPLSWRLRWLAAVVALPLFIPDVSRPASGQYEVTFLDVGQGTAIVVRTREHVLVYDTGARFSDRFNAADAVILPFLRTGGLRQVDRLVISHADGDHSGGAPALLDGIQVDDVMVSAPLESINAGLCRTGQTWVWDDVQFEVLHPDESYSGSKNDRSCVLMITSGDGVRTLLTGDIEARGERQLIERGLGAVAILLSPHHGSATSSSRDFVRMLAPEFVVHTTGFRNRYGFPHLQVQQTYRQQGTVQFNTAISGAVTFTLGGEQRIDVSAYRPQQQTFWHSDWRGNAWEQRQ